MDFYKSDAVVNTDRLKSLGYAIYKMACTRFKEVYCDTKETEIEAMLHYLGESEEQRELLDMFCNMQAKEIFDLLPSDACLDKALVRICFYKDGHTKVLCHMPGYSLLMTSHYDKDDKARIVTQAVDIGAMKEGKKNTCKTVSIPGGEIEII